MLYGCSTVLIKKREGEYLILIPCLWLCEFVLFYCIFTVSVYLYWICTLYCVWPICVFVLYLYLCIFLHRFIFCFVFLSIKFSSFSYTKFCLSSGALRALKSTQCLQIWSLDLFLNIQVGFIYILYHITVTLYVY